MSPIGTSELKLIVSVAELYEHAPVHPETEEIVTASPCASDFPIILKSYCYPTTT